MNQDEQKKAVARAALKFVSDGCVLGVGTGSTAEAFIDALASARIEPAKLVSSSRRSTIRLEQAGYKVSELNEVGPLDVYVDGADECTRRFTLIKGGGGAHSIEKILAAAAARFVVVVDQSKMVDMHCKFPVPVEVLPQARSLIARKLVGLGGRPVWREGFVTDSGNPILDVHDLDLKDAAGCEAEICALAGVVDCGICATRLADTIVLSDQEGTIEELSR
ncbi:MAG: ribose-5-phosphate isomerase RpiA [Betaproteobacteria bacterium]|nr:ribose-5-phosphate isomerase RpiA [Betaproteobacteria bacterium]